LLVGIFAGSVLVFGGSRLVKMSFDLGQSSPAMGIPMGFVYGVIPLAGLVMLGFSVHSLVLHAREDGGSGDA
jgi:TRAP-type C4-dicarboxylate transport system permease small subunit